MKTWDRFAAVAGGAHADHVPVALIVDSPWLPGFAGMDTLDFFLRGDEWLRIHLLIRDRFPEVTWIPGYWIEYGMAAEPSAFGARIHWHHDQPPSIEPVAGGLNALLDVEPPDPQQHGLMPLVLRRYLDAERRLLPEGESIKMVAARGPFAIAGWLLGIGELMIALKKQPDRITRLLDTLTTTVIQWLQAQLGVLRTPEGVLVLDDLVGMLSPRLFEQYARPCMSRIFQSFDGLIKVYHNDTPCPHLLGPMANLGFDVFNFSHTIDITEAQAQMPNAVLMGNVPPLDVMVRGTADQVTAFARECIAKTAGRGLILSAGGGVSPDTPASAIDALVKAVSDAD
jgi:uroporphyrinogen-III decarboxylase